MLCCGVGSDANADVDAPATVVDSTFTSSAATLLVGAADSVGGCAEAADFLGAEDCPSRSIGSAAIGSSSVTSAAASDGSDSPGFLGWDLASSVVVASGVVGSDFSTSGLVASGFVVSC